MSDELTVKIPYNPRIGGGLTITAVGTEIDQAIHWELVSYDPITQLEGAPFGSLAYEDTKTNAAKLATNIYTAPVDPGLAGSIDRVKISSGYYYTTTTT